jgi:hypothetical protein
MTVEEIVVAVEATTIEGTVVIVIAMLPEMVV